MKKLLTAISLIFIVQFSFGQELIPYEENGKFGYQDSVGNVVIPAKYDNMGHFSEGFVAVSLNEKWGFINTTGKEIIQPKYYSVYGFHNKSAVVVSRSYRKTIDEHTEKPIRIEVYKYGIIDTKGKKIIPLKYEHIYRFKGGETAIEKKGKFGLLNKNGKRILPIMYESISSFSSEGLYGVKLNEKWGFVNEKNQVVIPFQFFDIDTEEGFVNGKIKVRRSESSEGFYIDKNGREVKAE